jgi:hypothetical protein
MALYEGKNSRARRHLDVVVPTRTSAPAAPSVGQLFWHDDPDTSGLQYWNGGSWDQVAGAGGGSRGPEGPAGPQGDPGVDGQDGSPGADGAKGNTGNTGSPGTDGQTGADGAKGDDGAPGSDGTDGAKGDKGDQGVPPDKVLTTHLAGLFTLFGRVDANGDQTNQAAGFSSSKLSTGVYSISFQPNVFVDLNQVVTATPIVGDLTNFQGVVPVAVVDSLVSNTACKIGIFDSALATAMDCGFMFTVTGQRS